MLHSSESRFSIGVPVQGETMVGGHGLDRFGYFRGVILDVLGFIQCHDIETLLIGGVIIDISAQQVV